MTMFADTMSPRDSFALQRVVSSVVTLAVGTPVPVAKENPDRVCLILLSCANAAFAIAPYSSSTTANMWVSPTNGQFVLTYDQHGKIAQVEWYALTTAMGSNLLVIENILDRTPQEYAAMRARKSNAPVSARGSPSDRNHRQLAAWVESITGGADNLRPIDQSLYALIRRRSGGP